MPRPTKFTDELLIQIINETINEFKGDGFFLLELSPAEAYRIAHKKYPSFQYSDARKPIVLAEIEKYNYEVRQYRGFSQAEQRSVEKKLGGGYSLEKYMKKARFDYAKAWNLLNEDIAHDTASLISTNHKKDKIIENLREEVAARKNGDPQLLELIQKLKEENATLNQQLEQSQEYNRQYLKEKNELIRIAGLQVIDDTQMAHVEVEDNPIARAMTYLTDLEKREESQFNKLRMVKK